MFHTEVVSFTLTLVVAGKSLAFNVSPPPQAMEIKPNRSDSSNVNDFSQTHGKLHENLVSLVVIK
jgi:hypothetical protein